MKNRLKLNSSSNHLIGISIDHGDGHKRITQAEQFLILGGSQESHQFLTETFLKVFNNLKQTGRQLETLEPDELFEIINEVLKNF
ncbi:MAG: hypothetical protein C5B43_05035 [Verrucomicrobia bacterium]|nr:MAG: hypothetical protein C5B43_05035 [Verrucomicrobiota bacterium]